MELFISPGTFGLVTSDSDSILILTYIHLGKCRIHLCEPHPHDSTLQNVPLLRHDGISIRGVKNILSYLRRQNYGLEYDLTDYEKVELTSLVAVIERHLTPALNWFLWAEDDVFRKFTRQCYIAGLSWPASVLLPFRWRRSEIRRAQHSQLANCTHSMSDAEIGNEIYALAKRCLTSLSYVLGKNNYFVANRPTAVDAYLFARLWPLLLYESQHGHADWPSIGLSQTVNPGQTASHPVITHLIQCPNLVAHFARIQNEHFPQAAVIFHRERELASVKRQQSSGPFSAHPIRDCLLLGTGVACLFLWYAKSIGLIRISSA